MEDLQRELAQGAGLAALTLETQHGAAVGWVILQPDELALRDGWRLDLHVHPAFRASRARVSPARRRYAGVLVDIFYDHLLARDWAEHGPAPLPAYCAGIYRHIAERLDDLPAPAHHALQLMARENWLGSYADIDGIADVLRRMALRARQPNPLAGSEAEFLADADGFAEDFRAWLGDARKFATGRMQTLAPR